MNYYTAIDILKWHFQNDPIVNEVTQGDIFSVDLNKKTIFPLVHMIVNSSTAQEFAITYNVSILAMDIVDFSKQIDTDQFYGMDNETDALNSMHDVLLRAYKLMKSGLLWDQKVQIEGEANLEPFAERFENNLAGWTMTFDITVPNEMTICDTDAYSPYCQPVTIENTDESYTASAASGSTFVIPDTTFNVQIDGTQVASNTYPTLSTQTINLIWQ